MAQRDGGGSSCNEAWWSRVAQVTVEERGRRVCGRAGVRGRDGVCRCRGIWERNGRREGNNGVQKEMECTRSGWMLVQFGE